MAERNNLAQSDLRKIWKAIRELRYASPVNNTAIGRDGLLVYDGGVITIENGGLDITGTATISGRLDVSGTTTFSGATTIAGPTGITGPLTVAGTTDVTGAFNVTGPTTLAGTLDITGDTTVTGALGIEGDTTITGALGIEGDTEISGNLDITGDSTISGTLGIEGITTLQSDLNVENNGRIKAGRVEIWPDNIAFEGGGITSSPTFGARFTSTDGRPAVLESTQGPAEVAGTSVALKGNTTITGWLSVTSPIVQLQNLSNTSNPPNLYRDPSSGRLYQSTWTP